MATEENCWRCGRLGILDDECAGCGATVSAHSPVPSKSNDPKERELDRIAEKYKSGKRSSSAAAPALSEGEEELALLREIAINTASTTKAVGFLAAAALYITGATFISYFLYYLGMLPVQNCYSDGCSPNYGFVIAAGVTALAGVIAAMGALRNAASQRVTR